MNEDRYIHLIYKRLEGELSTPEQQQLNDWLQESSDHRLIAHSVEKVWQLGEGTDPDIAIDLDTDFALLEKRISQSGETVNDQAIIRPLKRRTPWWQIAAAVAVLLAFAFLTRNYLSSGTEWESIANTDGGKKDILLADGTHLWLNHNSRITFPKEFLSGERKVKMEGEVFFEVTKDAARPFIIETPSGEVKVLGTSFNVRDFSSDKKLIVEVVSGSVQLKKRNSKTAIIMVAGESGILDKENDELKKQNQSYNTASWHTRKLQFNETPMNLVFADIEAFYQVKIELGPNQWSNCTFSSSFEDQPLEVVLETINTVFDTQSQKTGDKQYKITGGNSCE